MDSNENLLGEAIDAHFTKEVLDAITASFVAGIGAGNTFTEDDLQKVFNEAKADWLTSRLWGLVEQGQVIVGLNDSGEITWKAPTPDETTVVNDLLDTLRSGKSRK